MRFSRVIQLGLVTSLLWLPAPLAQAHADLVSSNPAVGAHLDALPTRIEITFDGNLLTIGGAKTNVLIVKDPQGSQIDAMNSHVSGATLSVDVNPVTASGEFTVSWRVVSSDGHPEEGSYQFTVGQTTVSASPTPSESTSPATSAPAPNASDEDFLTRYGTRLALLLAAALAVGIWIRFERARRKLQ